jgi:hypothetical protein
MTLVLRAEFHRWSRWYPARWRHAHGAAMLGTFLDLAEAEGRERLTRSDKAALVLGGIAARADVVVPSPVRDRVATIMIGLLGTLGLVTGVCFEWAPWATRSRAEWLASSVSAALEQGAVVPGSFGPFLSPFVIVSTLAVACLVTCLIGPDLVYRLCLAATVVAASVLVVLAHLVPAMPLVRATPCLFTAIVVRRRRSRAASALCFEDAALHGDLPAQSLVQRDRPQ